MLVFETLPDGLETLELRFGDGAFLTWELLPIDGLSFTSSSSLCNEFTK